MEWNLTAVSLLIPLLFLLIGLAVFVVIDPYISRKHRWVMGIMLGLSASLSARNIWKDYLSADPLRWGLCRKDPAQADAALLKFGRYLRVSGFVRKPCDRLRLAEEFAHLRYAAT